MNRAERRAVARMMKQPWKSPHVTNKRHAWCKAPSCSRPAKRQIVFAPGMFCGRCLAFGDLLGRLWNPPPSGPTEDEFLARVLAEFERQEQEDADEGDG